MGHSSVKLTYYRQNAKAREDTYRQIEYAVTIADTEKFNENLTQQREENQELRKTVDSLSRWFKNLEKKVEIMSR